MKNDLLRRVEAKYAAQYAALYHAKIGMTLQLAQDAAMIAANEVLQMGPGRAPDFANKMREVVNEIADVMLADQKDDEKFAYTRGVVDRRLKKICGEHFVPWEERYGQE